MEWPVEALSKAMLQSQRDMAAYMKANCAFLEEMQSIVRKEQDIAFEAFDKFLDRFADGNWTRGPAIIDPKEMTELMDRAMDGVREFGDAWVEAQLRMIDTVRSQVREAEAVGEKVAERVMNESPMAAAA
jgi:hypothetical protein